MRGLDRWPFDVWSAAAGLAQEIDATEAFAAGLRLVEPGAALAERLELPPTSRLDWELQQIDRARGRFHLEALLRAPTARERAQVLRRALLPHPHWIARQYPWAADHPARLPAAYLVHVARSPLWALRTALFHLRQRRAGRV